MKVTLIVRCIYCKKRREIGPNETFPTGVPMCECGGAMVAEKAQARTLLAKLEGKP